MKSLPKPKTVFFLFFFLSAFYLLLAAKAAAQVPPPYVPCGKTESPEFHSLRPYQASPCQSTVSSYAKFCGNELTLKDTITETYSPGDPNCQPVGGKIRCTYNVHVDKPITIDLSGANLPIMGNTEEVKNSQNNSDQFDDAKKVNEYVSWYLNGVSNRAEYSFLDSEKKEDLDKIINFSGPLKKLLPEKIQRDVRVNTIKNAGETRHDQIVGCVYNLLGLFNVGQIIECYPKTWDKAEVRLSDWVKNNHLPPNEEDFNNFSDYWTAYKEWRGRSCITILGFTLCIDNPFKPNYWGNLFQNIPFSSTEDLKGGVSIDSVSSAANTSSGVEVKNVKFSNQKPADLFFSHMEESAELGALLQDTFAQKGADKAGSPTLVDSGASCSTVEVRSNKGDDLFTNQIRGDLAYDASFTCDFNPPSSPSDADVCRQLFPKARCYPNDWSCKTNHGKYDCPGGFSCAENCSPPVQTCTKDIYINLSTSSNTPKVDEIWSRLVAGPSAIFKRIFPKTNTAGSVGTILDMPGATKISYQGSGISADTELRFPHLGGISEYFLKGIQTILRPKGYGEQITFGQGSSATTCGSGGNIPNLPSASGSCSISAGGSLNIPLKLAEVIGAAATTFNVPPSLILGVMYGEGAFNPGKYDWADENVNKWIAEGACMPGCNPNIWPSTGVIPFFESYWENIKNAVNTIDPDRKSNPCNLLDAIFALAKDLRQSQNGSGAFTGKTCFGIALNAGSGGSNSCSWDNSDVETAIRVWEFGTAYNSSITCATKPGSCAGGGGFGAACPGGDFCEKVGGSGNTSHNACIWNVAHSY